MEEMALRRRIGSTRAAGAAFLRREIACCRSEIATLRSKTGRAVPLAAAVGWSAAAVMWGNAVVVAGRRYGHDQWISLVGVPVFGVAGAWWLCRQRGFRLTTIGLRLPRVGGGHIVVAGLTVAAALGGPP